VGAYRAPHRGAGGHGRVAAGVAEVDVFPAQRAGFFGADAGGQAQGDVGVHPGIGGGGQERGGLAEGQAFAGPPGLAFGGVDERGDVAPDKVAGLGVADGPGDRVVAHRHRGRGVPGGHGIQRLPYVGRGELAEPAGADRGQDGRQDVFVLLDGLGRPAVQSLAQPVVGGVPERIVRPGLDAGVEVIMKRAQPVLDDGPGFAGDLAPDAFPVGPESEADHAPPAALAVPVPFAVAAGGGVLEEDPVLAPAAPCAHGFQGRRNGGHSWGPSASYMRRHSAMPSHEVPGRSLISRFCGLVREPSDVYGKEKVYGSIP
jgi:hypothetical protein